MNLQSDFIKPTALGGIKGLISELPYIGGVVTGMWDSYHETRLQNFINELHEKLKNVDEKKIDRDYIQSEEFCDLFRRALQSRVLHRSKMKARFILGHVVESIRNDRDKEISTSLKESFLNILDQLTDEEMKLLYDFFQGKYNNFTKEKFYEKAKGLEIDGIMAAGILTSGFDQRIKASALGEKFINYMRIVAKESIKDTCPNIISQRPSNPLTVKQPND